MSDPGEAALLATAAGMLSWHRGNKFCCKCASPMVSRKGGNSLACSSSTSAASAASAGCGGGSIYPRINPAAITLVTCKDYVLLGRKADWPPMRYSLLAGFVELGETLEQGAAREVLEESGVELDEGSIGYRMSQPWPFPSSLMIGMHAEAKWNDPRKGGEGTGWTVLDLLGSDLSSPGRAAAVSQQMTHEELEDALLPDRCLLLLEAEYR